MKNQFKFLMIILCTNFYLNMSAQSNQDLLNLKKYWWYHHRLLRDFMVKGDCQGCSEPMDQRADLDHGGDPACSTNSHVAKWGDLPDNLGDLMGVLATEYRLEADNHLPTDSTIEELYYVLKAFNRMDELAEPWYTNNHLEFNISSSTDFSQLNGFFVRDDVPSNFLIQHPHLTHRVTSQYDISTIVSDWANSTDMTADGEKNLYGSTDHCWHIMAGCALIRASLPDGITYHGLPLNDVNGQTDIRSEAYQISERIINYMKLGTWIINNPAGAATISGGSALQNSYGAAEAAAYIRNANECYDVPYLIAPFRCNPYQDVISVMTRPLWNGYGTPAGAAAFYGLMTPTNSQTDFFKPLFLAAIGNSWFTRLHPYFPDPGPVWDEIYSRPLFYALHPDEFFALLATLAPEWPSNITEYELAPLCYLNPDFPYEWLPMLRQYLHGGGNTVPEHVYTGIDTYFSHTSAGTYSHGSLLNSAPCDGPHNFGFPGCSAPFEWSTHNRLRAPDERGDRRDWYYLHPPTPVHPLGEYAKLGEAEYGEYNGIDYMLMYNLHALTRGLGSGIPYENFMDRTITYSFPMTIGSYGSSALPATIDAFHTITASNIVNSNADVTYHAGTEIILKPGFEALAGSNFDAYVAPFHCASDNDYRHRLTNNDSSNSHSPTDNAVAYNGPLTYVDYPKYTRPTDYYVQNTASSKPVTTKKTSNNKPMISAYNAPSSGIVVSPNPSHGTFVISLLSTEQVSDPNSTLTIYDIMGKVVVKQAFNNVAATIDISTESKGMYYVKIENSQGVKVEKIIYQ